MVRSIVTKKCFSFFVLPVFSRLILRKFLKSFLFSISVLVLTLVFKTKVFLYQFSPKSIWLRETDLGYAKSIWLPQIDLVAKTICPSLLTASFSSKSRAKWKV